MARVVCVGDLLIDFVPTATGTGLADAPAFVKAPGGARGQRRGGPGPPGGRERLPGHGRRRPVRPFPGRDAAPTAGVDVGPLRFTAKARTALAFVSLRADGEREFMFYRHPSADMLFTPDEVDTGAVEAARLLHFDSISLASANPRASSLFAADRARAAGRLVSYDVNLRLPLWPDADAARAGILTGLGKAHLVKLSDDELIPDRQPRAGGRAPALARPPAARDPDPRPRRLHLLHRRAQYDVPTF